MSSRRAGIPVWDALQRISHWSLVAGIAVAWFTRHARGGWHEWVGYGVLAVLILRLAWGFGPSHYARFRQFLRSPAVTARYAGDVLRGRQRRYLGHNPLGGWMIVVLLSLAAVVCLSGWLYTTDRYWGVAWVEALHRWSTWVLLGAVALHVAGVVHASWHGRENLVAAMLHGYKRPPAGDDVA